MGNTKDFFFGDFLKSNQIDLHDLSELGTDLNKHNFHRQLNRLLENLPDNKLVVTNGTSHPIFGRLLDTLVVKDITKVIITNRTDRNSNVKGTLACDLYLDHGIISVRPHWCARNDIRADEIATTLIKPLIQYGLYEYAWIIRDDSTKPLKLSSDYHHAFYDLIAVNGYGDVYEPSELKRIFELINIKGMYSQDNYQ